MAATPPSPSAPAGGAHHGLPPHEVVLLLQTDPHRGLHSTEAADRLRRYGPNLLPSVTRGGWLARLGRQFHNPLIYILIVAGAVTAALGEYVDSAVIFGVVVVNAGVGYVQEAKAQAALDALRSLARTPARVIRDGHEVGIVSDEVVVGDLVLVAAGEKVPADIRLVRETELEVDESALTGESTPVVKDEVVLPPETPVADRRNMLYSGTLVTAGTGAGVAVGTGSGTELGQIHRLISGAESLATPLTRKLARFSRTLTVVILALAAVTFGVGLLRGERVVEMFTAAIALAVGAIPEGLPAAVTITLAIGVGRMARRHAVVRRLPAVETLGSTTVICTDKTGTLTRNEMTVRAVWTPDAEFEVTGVGYAPDGEFRPVAADPGVVETPALRWCLLAGAGCNDAGLTHEDGRWGIVGDPSEAALLVAAAKYGLSPAAVAESYPRLATIPFTSERLYMATLHRDRRAGECVVLIKGAAERVLDLCHAEMGLDGNPRRLDRDAAQRAAERYAQTGLRVLATAVRLDASDEDFDETRLPGSLVFTGLHAMLDPPREAAGAAIGACRAAGVTVKMITGDHAATATAIADQLGLLDGPDRGQVLTGAQLAQLPEDRLAAEVDRARVFARVTPEQKLRLVRAMQDRGHVVAMTGNGVNDAPALRQADIGVAMGLTGTEVAKEAANIVLTDDDFTTIEAAVEEGRGVYDNLTKFIVWTLPTNAGEGLVLLLAIVLGAALPVLPTQILWINMTTAVLLGLTLAFEPKEQGIMSRPPRDPRQPVVTGALVTRILLVSALLVAGSWWLFTWESAHGATIEEARTAAVNVFVAVQAFYLFSCRTLYGSVLRIGFFSNRWIIVGVALQAVGQFALTYLPALNALFHTAPVGAEVWLRIFAIAAAASVVVGADKWLRQRLARRRAVAHSVSG